MDDNKIEYSCSNIQEGDYEFNRDDKPTQAQIADLTAYFDENFLKRAVNGQTTKSNISMAAGFLFLEASQDWSEDHILISTTHAERPNGISKEIMAKV